MQPKEEEDSDPPSFGRYTPVGPERRATYQPCSKGLQEGTKLLIGTVERMKEDKVDMEEDKVEMEGKR